MYGWCLTLMEDFSVCPPCSLTDIGADLKKPNVSLQSRDQPRLCSPRKDGNWRNVGGRECREGGKEGGGGETEGGREGGEGRGREGGRRGRRGEERKGESGMEVEGKGGGDGSERDGGRVREKGRGRKGRREKEQLTRRKISMEPAVLSHSLQSAGCQVLLRNSPAAALKCQLLSAGTH